MERYVIITPAKNEGKYIEKTIQSVISQTIKPIKWVIVNDYSKDNTQEIIENYGKEHDFIVPINKNGTEKRDYSSKVHAINEGLNEIKHLDFEYLCILDADISFAESYFDVLLREFRKDDKLAIAGGLIYDNYNDKFLPQKISSDSVAGAVQMFRYTCYKDIGGFVPQQLGGEDAVVEIKARMKGWNVRTYKNLKVLHYKQVGRKDKTLIQRYFNGGVIQYVLGYYWLFAFLKNIVSMTSRPYVIAGIMQNVGYIYALIKQNEFVVPEEVKQYLRSEHKMKLKRIILTQ